MDMIRVGILGAGMAGMGLARTLVRDTAPGMVLSALCDQAPRVEAARQELQCTCQVFSDYNAMLAAKTCDLLAICTPHPFHPEQTIAALNAGYHVLCEKPAAIAARHARAMCQAAKNNHRLLSVNLNRRLHPLSQTLKDLFASGRMGAIHRIQWTITDWYRTQAYFDSAPWRGTWAGEGGGLLVNQAPHNLDLWQWLFGLPARVNAHCHFGRYHDIEVEDEVTAYLEYADGASGVLILSTGEAPGTNRLEVACDRGRVVVENDEITLQETDTSITRFSRESPDAFANPKIETHKVSSESGGIPVAGLLKNLAQAIRGESPLLVSGDDAVRSVEMSNAILLSSWNGGWVDLPTDSAKFEKELERRRSTPRIQKATASRVLNLEASLA